MDKLRRKKFGEILIAEGIISRDELRQALEVQRQTGETLGEILLREAIISESDIIRCICTQYGLPFLRPSAYSFDREFLTHFPPDFLYVHRLIPVDQIGDCTLVCIGEIPDEKAEEALLEKYGDQVHFYFAPSAEIEQILIQQFSFTQEQILALDDQRRGRLREDQAKAQGQVAVPQAGVDPLSGQSWEAIFDQAEGNLSK